MSGLEDKISQFVSVTGCSVDVAKRYLEACAGNLDMAVGMQMENEASHPSFSAATSLPGAPVTDTHSIPQEPVLSPKSYEKTHGVRAPIPQTSGVLIEQEPPMLLPPRRMARTRRLPQTVFDPFQDYSVSSARGASGKGGSHSKSKKTPNLAELYKPPHDLLFRGSFEEAKRAGQAKRCWLLVNLQDSKEFSCQTLNRDLWSQQSVREVVQKYFVFTQIHRITAEGSRFTQLYHTYSYPTIAVIDPRTGELMVSWSAMNVEQFLMEVKNFLASNPFGEDGATLDAYAAGSIINESEQSQLEAAIQASLEEVNHRETIVVASDNSDVECILSTSDDDEEDGPKKGGATAKGVKSKRFAVQSVGRDSRDLNETTSNQRDHGTPQLDFTSSRKRPAAKAEGRPCARKRPRTDLGPVCDAINNIGLDRMMSIDEADTAVPSKPDSNNVKEDEGGGKERGKGGRTAGKKRATASRGSSSITSVSKGFSELIADPEVLLERGELQKDEVSQVLFRMPDGSRLHKTFLKSAPVKELVEFVASQGLKVSELDIVTHFPKRSVLEMDQSSTLEQCGLYPRETVFVHLL